MNLTTLRFIVIIGILSSATGARGTYDPKSRVPGYLRTLGFLNTTVADIEKYDEEMCTQSGGENAYENVKQSWQDLNSCIHSVIYQTDVELRDQPSSSITISRMSTTIRAYCRKVPEFENCFKNITVSVKTCLDPEKHEHVNVIYNILSSTMRYLCKDEGTPVVEFFVNDGERCYMSKKLDVNRCFNQTVLKHFQSKIHNGAAIGGLGALHLLAPDRDRCTVLHDFQHCTVEALRSCVQSPADLANSIFNIVKKETTCDRWFKSQASPVRAVNFLLITAITAISLRSAYE